MGGHGGATRGGCSELSREDNEIIKQCYKYTDATAQGVKRDACVYCEHKLLANNITKKVLHVAVCEAFWNKCKSDEPGSKALFNARDKIVLACVKYRDQSKALQKSSKFRLRFARLVHLYSRTIN